jgi:pimeloyl-ACP methyl ester carboxylesterase
MCIGAIISALAFPLPDPQLGASALERHAGRVQLVTSKHEGVPAVHIKASSARYTILYSHGNAEDVSISIDYLEEMAHENQVNVFAYEYVGYSLSALDGAKPSEGGCFRAIEAAWRYLVLTLAIPANTIIIFGRSLGSGPSLHLASQTRLGLPSGINNPCAECNVRKLTCTRHSPSSCGGVLIQSGLESGARVILNKCISLVCLPLDIMRNYRCLPRVRAPVAIMHGTDDEVVPIENGRNLFAMAKRPVEPLWLEGYGHNDLPQSAAFSYLRSFMAKIAEEQASGLGRVE